ncbi:MAG: GNAT family N-acetyltransferase [Streptosporangiaceae bacterium]
MRVKVVRPGDLGPEEARLWSAFQLSQPIMSNPFLSLTFAQTVGRFRPAARVAVVEDDGRTEAFLPFELAPGKVAVPIGCPMNDLQGFVGSGAAFDARAVVRKSGLRGWRFLHVPADQQALMPHQYQETVVRCPVIDLSGGYEQYQQSMAKTATYKNARKKQRSLERQAGPVRLAWGTPDQAHFDQLVDWKRGKYGGARRLFSDPAALRIIEALATAAADDCRGILSVMFAGERPIANVLGLAGPAGLSAWFSSYDPDWQQFSPGTIMWYLLAEQAAATGFTRIDFGGGQDGYKFSLANTSYPVAGGAVWANRVERAARGFYRHASARSPWSGSPWSGFPWSGFPWSGTKDSRQAALGLAS